jgi:hypothetical protein
MWIATIPHLRVLDFRGNGWIDLDLAKAFAENVCLTHLQLSGTKISWLCNEILRNIDPKKSIDMKC